MRMHLVAAHKKLQLLVKVGENNNVNTDNDMPGFSANLKKFTNQKRNYQTCLKVHSKANLSSISNDTCAIVTTPVYFQEIEID